MRKSKRFIGLLIRQEKNEKIKHQDGVEHKTDEKGNQFWYKNGVLHREGDKPAIERANGDKEWWKHGRKQKKKLKQLFINIINKQKLQMLIENRKNILIGGGTGSGKTTFLNAIIKKMEELTPDHNFYIVEDVPEIQCRAKKIFKRIRSLLLNFLSTGQNLLKRR